MAKITQVNNGDTGLQARTKINEAMKTVEVDATLTGTGEVGDPLSVNAEEIFQNNEIPYIDFVPQSPVTAWKRARLVYDSDLDTLTLYTDISDSSLQIGSELRARLLNNTGGLLPNGSVGFVTGASGSLITCDLATANDIDESTRALGVFTNDIADAGQGYIVRFGAVRNMDSSAFSAGDPLYLSPDTPGGLTNVRPMAPNYVVRVGICIVSHATLGVIGVDMLAFNGDDTHVNSEGMLNGLVLEKPSADFIVDTGVVYFETDNDNDPSVNLDFMIDGVRYQLDTLTGPGTGGKARVALTSGTDTAPVFNYIYIVETAGVGVLTANTTGFPSGSAPIGTCFLKSVTHTTNYGEFSFRRWNNAVDNGTGNGIFQYILKRLRLNGAKWTSGVTPTIAITTNPAAIDNLILSTTSGIVYQIHEQTFSAKDGTEYYIVNHPTTPYLRITDLNQIDVDANGNTLRNNNTRYGLNIIGVQSSGDTIDRLLVMLPSGSYSSDANAINDVNNYSNTNVPSGLAGVAFRICRIVVNYSTAASGTFTNLIGAGLFQDERGFPLGTAGGGGASGGAQTNFSDAIFYLFNSLDATKILNFDLSGITTGNARTLAPPDVDGTILVGKKGTVAIVGNAASQKVTFDGSALGSTSYTLILQAYDSDGVEGQIVRGAKETDGFNITIQIDSTLEYTAIQ